MLFTALLLVSALASGSATVVYPTAFCTPSLASHRVCGRSVRSSALRSFSELYLTAFYTPSLASHRLCGRSVRSRAQPSMSAGESPEGVPVIDEKAYEVERLSKDAEAMKQMQAVMERAADPSAAGFEKLRNPWKWEIRKRIWDYMEANNIARNPRPVHHRIPNFEGAELAAANLCSLPEFKSAKVVKVNPDTPQKEVRFGVLTSGKKLMAPQPRLRTGFFSTLLQVRVLALLVCGLSDRSGGKHPRGRKRGSFSLEQDLFPKEITFF